MRRIALLAGVTATLAGGAAALAAVPDPAAPGAAPADPYQGSWALTLDGRPAGPVARVDGCSLKAQVAIERTGSADGRSQHVAGATPEPCAIEFGGGMSPAFKTMLNDAVAGHGSRHDMQIVRIDPQGGGYAFDLANATIASLTVPKIAAGASGAPVYLTATLKAERLRRVVAHATTKAPSARQLVPQKLALTIGGRAVQATSVGPWTVTVKTADGIGELRDYAGVPSEVEVGDLPIRVPEADRRAMNDVLDPWVDAALTKGVDDERPVILSAGGITLSLDHAGIARADLAARADGARSYDLYAERAAIDAG